MLTSVLKLGQSFVMGYNFPDFGDKSSYNNLVKCKVQFKLEKKIKKKKICFHSNQKYV